MDITDQLLADMYKRISNEIDSSIIKTITIEQRLPHNTGVSDIQFKREVHNWLVDTVGQIEHKWDYLLPKQTYYFKNKQDLLLFTLRWLAQ